MVDLLNLDLSQHFRSYICNVFRLVEGQYFISTRKLVDSDYEQQILEEIIDSSKPIAPIQNSAGRLHYLLYTPFRYPPLKDGGRFHTRLEQSIFYASEELRTAMSEIAYKRFLFLEHTTANISPMEVPYTHFMIKVQSQKSIILTDTPFVHFRDKISSPHSYAFSQQLGYKMRSSGCELFRYNSARLVTGHNVGLISPEAFAYNSPLPGKERQYSVYIDANVAEFRTNSVSKHRNVTETFTKKEYQ